MKALWLSEGSQTTLRLCLRDGCAAITQGRDLPVCRVKALSFPLLSRGSLASLVQNKRKQRERAAGGQRGCNGTHIHAEPTRVRACAGSHVPIASSWHLAPNPEATYLPNQLKSKLLREHEPGCSPFGGAALSHRRVSSPRKKVWGHRKEDSGSYHFDKHPLFKNCYRFLISKQERQILD